MKLIIGLGNIGQQYATTRHNAGFLAVEQWAQRHGKTIATPWRPGQRLLGHIAQWSWAADDRQEEVVCVEPATMMNASGHAVRVALSAWRAALSDCLVVCDDMQLPVGQLRLRTRGSAGGHHGLESIADAVGSNEFARLRIGVGLLPTGHNASAFVLAPLTSPEWRSLADALITAAVAIETWLVAGAEAAMNQFNRRMTSEGA